MSKDISKQKVVFVERTDGQDDNVIFRGGKSVQRPIHLNNFLSGRMVASPHGSKEFWQFNELSTSHAVERCCGHVIGKKGGYSRGSVVK